MKLLFIDQLRKIKKNLFNFISLSLLVIIITMTFTAVKSSLRRLDENYEPYLEAQSLEDFYFAMGNIDISLLSGSTTLDLCEELDMLYECYYAFSFPNDPTYINLLNVQINEKLKDEPELYESIIDGYANYFTDEYDYTYEKSYVVDMTQDDQTYKFISHSTTINVAYLVDGEYPDQLDEIAIFPDYAEYHNINIGDTLTIKDREFHVTGFFYKPEYLFPIFSLSNIQFDAQNQTMILATEETIRDLGEYVFIKYLVQGDLNDAFPAFGYSNIQSNDYSLLGKYMQMVYVLMPSDINFRIIALDIEITNATQFINVFLPLFIVLITILLLVFMKRYIDQNKKDIQTLRSLGYTNKEITLSLMTYPTLVSVFVFVGYGLGLLLSMWMFDIYSARYLFPKAEFMMYSDIFVLSTIVPFVFFIFTNLLFISFSLRPKKQNRKSRFLRVSKYVDNKTLLATTFIFFLASILLIFGFSGNTMFTEFITITKEGNHYEEMVSLQYMTGEDHLDTYETYTKTTGKIIEVNSRALKTVKTTTIYGILPTTQLKRLINDDVSQNLLLEQGVIVSDYLYTELDLAIGDTITFEVGGVTTQEQIVGVSNELIENNFYMSKASLNGLYNLDTSYYNGLFTTDDQYDSPYVNTRINYNTTIDDMASLLNISSIIINYLVTLSIVLGLFIFGLIIMNYFTQKQRDIAVLKSLGYNTFEINKKYLLIPYLSILIMYIIAIPVTDYLLNFLLKAIMSTVGFKLVVHVSVLHMIIGFVVIHIISICVVYFSSKYIDSVPLSQTLKHQDQ